MTPGKFQDGSEARPAYPWHPSWLAPRVPHSSGSPPPAPLHGRLQGPPGRAYQGKALPVDHGLPVLGASGQEVSFSRTLKRMGAGQLLTVCTLGSYRGNGPYNDFMDRCHWFTETLGERLHELHVITSNAEKEKHADW